MTFNHLSDGDFEEFAYDLLVGLGFVNVSWRRGSGRGGASADQGRDVVAQLHRRDVDSTEHLEMWFVQCKHYERGVPPEPLQGAVTWASAERPSVLLFVVSNVLSNPAKAWLEDYERNNRPPFRIKLWERKELERLVVSQPAVAAKYRLEVGGGPRNVHPAHLQYALQPSWNSLEFFFETLDSIDPSVRDDAFSFAFHSIINPRFRKPQSGNETIGELMVDKVDYDAFRHRCYEVAELGVAEDLIVQAVVGHTLGWAWRFADPVQLPSTLSRHRDAIAYLSEQIRTETDEGRIDTLRGMVSFTEKMMLSAPQRQQQAAIRYRILCEDVLPRLELEESFRLAEARKRREA